MSCMPQIAVILVHICIHMYTRIYIYIYTYTVSMHVYGKNDGKSSTEWTFHSTEGGQRHQAPQRPSADSLGILMVSAGLKPHSRGDFTNWSFLAGDFTYECICWKDNLSSWPLYAWRLTKAKSWLFERSDSPEREHRQPQSLNSWMCT